MTLPLAYAEGMTSAMKKFAVSGALYARALQSAAQRGGGRIAPQILSQLAAKPRATASPFLSGNARTPGTLTPTPQQQGLQRMMDKVPFVGAEYHSDAGARSGLTGEKRVQVPAQRAGVQAFNTQLQQTGRVTAHPGLQQQLDTSFGPASAANHADTVVGGPATAVQGQAAASLAHDPTMLVSRPADATRAGYRKAAALNPLRQG